MIFVALKGSALKKARSFYESGGVGGTRKSEDCTEFLDRINLHMMWVARTNDKLHTARMKGGQCWPDFLASWSKKLTKARGDFWDNPNKISMPRNSLIDNLKRTLAGNHLLPENDFDKWIRIVNKVAQELDMVEIRSNVRFVVKYSGISTEGARQGAGQDL